MYIPTMPKFAKGGIVQHKIEDFTCDIPDSDHVIWPSPAPIEVIIPLDSVTEEQLIQAIERVIMKGRHKKLYHIYTHSNDAASEKKQRKG